MKLEIRNYKKYFETGYEPEISSLRTFEISPDGKGGNYGYIHCTNKEEVEKYLEIIKKCGVAHTNNIERLICSIFIENKYLKGIDILNAINKAGEEEKLSEERLTSNNEWWHIDNDEFCHHSKEEAKYWCVINELTKKQVEKYLY